MADVKPKGKKPRAPRPVAFVRCGGGSPATEGGPCCEQGCIGCGACVEACHFGAIKLNDRGVAFVDASACKGCGLCAKKCPRGVIELVPAGRDIRVRCINAEPGAVARKMCTVSCISCSACVRACPAGAMTISNNHAHIDYNLCISCGMCAVNCPRGAISDVFGLFAEV